MFLTALSYSSGCFSAYSSNSFFHFEKKILFILKDKKSSEDDFLWYGKKKRNLSASRFSRDTETEPGMGSDSLEQGELFQLITPQTGTQGGLQDLFHMVQPVAHPNQLIPACSPQQGEVSTGSLPQDMKPPALHQKSLFPTSPAMPLPQISLTFADTF